MWTEFPVQGKALPSFRQFSIRFNWEVIAYSLSERPVMEMVNTMLTVAFPKPQTGDAPLLHSDQGWHYRMRAIRTFKGVWDDAEYVAQTKLPDNAVMENFSVP